MAGGEDMGMYTEYCYCGAQSVVQGCKVSKSGGPEWGAHTPHGPSRGLTYAFVIVARAASIVACAWGGVCSVRHTHTLAHTLFEVPPTRPVRGTSNPYPGAEGGSRVLGRDSSARCIALVCGSQVREMGPCVGKKLPSHDPDSHTLYMLLLIVLRYCWP